MCGIAGVYNYSNVAENDRPFMQWALTTMHHRGPDSNGIWANEHYTAGFVRLAIRDLSAKGSQPMLSEDGNYCLSFNGEIYNSDTFKPSLRHEGVTFKTTTDTEVLLYALIHFGVEYVLAHFDGIFAFALYNNTTRQLILARDRAGIKPLYIGKCSKGIVYSSQYDHIINHPYFSNNAIDEGALGAYLCLGYVPENSGIISGTYLLPHGHYVAISPTNFTTKQYYDYPLQQTSKSEASLEEAIQASVQSQLVSDVAVGSFMSGGVDSPLVSCYANRSQGIKSFTIGVEDERFGEQQAAASYASIFKTQHHCKMITNADLLKTIEDNTRAFSEPFADYSSIPTLVLSAYARQQVTVALSGDGGDELFWGYPRNTKMLQQGLPYQKKRWQRLLEFTRQKVVRRTNRTIIKKHLQERFFSGFYYRSLFVKGADYWLPKVFKGKAANAWWFTQLAHTQSAKQTDRRSNMNVLRKLEFDIHLQRILLKVDRASMLHSLEVRVPLLSNQMIGYSATLQHTDCIQGASGKSNLKNLLRQQSGSVLVDEPKKGFVIPLGDWINGTLRSDIEDKLLNMPTDLAVFFRRDKIRQLLYQHFSGAHDWSWFIWTLYSLVNWSNYHRRKYRP